MKQKMLPWSNLLYIYLSHKNIVMGPINSACISCKYVWKKEFSSCGRVQFQYTGHDWKKCYLQRKQVFKYTQKVGTCWFVYFKDDGPEIAFVCYYDDIIHIGKTAEIIGAHHFLVDFLSKKSNQASSHHCLNQCA